ncbi:MAG: hypothetical protein IT184_01740 [Acidobacteria bacterium]|nr:hypothetical protein [Acidobacteriota bacterium]
MRRRAPAAIVAIAVCVPACLSAQAAGPSPAAAGWQSGVVVQSTDGDNRLTLGGILQVDGRFVDESSTTAVDTFAIRKARLVMGGRVAKYFEFRIVPDFGNGQATLADAYFDFLISPALRIRAGKDKSPVGYELLISDAAVLFLDRSLSSGLVPNRDVGIQAQGDLAGGTVAYAAGVLNGVPDGTSSTTDTDTNGGKDLAARVAVRPFRSLPAWGGALRGLGFHLGGSTGEQAGALPAYRTSGGQTYFAYAPAGSSSPAVVASGRRSRTAPAVFYYYKSFGAFAEYVRTTQPVARAQSVVDATNHGWDVTASYLLTGEAATAGLPAPATPFDPSKGSWGALQIVARCAALTIDPAIFEAGLAATGASRRAQQFTIGLNWYPTAAVKYYLDYERTSFDTPAPGARPTEHVISFRLQLAI